MSTFQQVNDDLLIELLANARQRVVFIAPGVHEPVAKALGRRFEEVDRLHVTVVIDLDEDVCRIGYGDVKGLQLLSGYAAKQSFALMTQPGLRIGVLLVDDLALVWSPTPRSVEASPNGSGATPAEGAPNGVFIGTDAGDQLAHAVSAAGTDTLPSNAEIGRQVVTPEDVQRTVAELSKNPPIPVDLARITRVFSTKLQFVEFAVKGAKFSKRELRIANDYLNSDIQGDLKGLVDSKLRAFGEFRDEEVEVSAFTNGEEVFDRNQNRLEEKVSEATLLRHRNDLERRYLYTIPGFGRLIAKDDKQEFVKLVNAYKTQLSEYSTAIRQKLNAQTNTIIDEALKLVADRAKRSGTELGKEELKSAIEQSLERAKDESPEVKLVFKDVTYEQTRNPEFHAKLEKALPPAKRKQLGVWSQDFEAARASLPKTTHKQL